MMAAMSAIFAMIFMLFMDTIFSNYLLSIGVGEDYLGYIFAIPSLLYVIFAPIAGYYSNKIPKIYMTQFAFALSVIALLLFGPSKVLNFPQHLSLIIVGGCFLGIALAFIFVPLLSDIVDAVKEKEGIEEENEKLNDLSSGFFNISYAIGCLLAPILGGAFNQLVGYRYTCDIFAFSSLIYTFLLFFLVVLPYALNSRK